MRWMALIATLSAALTAGCGGTRPVEPSSAPSEPALRPVPGIEAEVVRLRTDEAIGGQVQVRITDTGTEPFSVRAVSLDSPGFRKLPATVVEATFEPGRTIDLPTPFGEVVCTATPLPATAEVTVERPGRTVEDLRVPLEADVLGRIHADECAAQGVLEVVAVEVTGLREDGNTLRGELTLTRRAGEEPVTASRLGRSVLIDVAVDGLPVRLEGERSASAPLSFEPATCDPHVLSETKQPYVFPLALTVGGNAAVVLDLPLDETARGLLAALVARVCARPG